ncbi:MAG: D-alanyl-D-alanine carboxypeptidase/D-alanyl-D-alanine-endopeptidase [Candidatus Amoebophilus sp. 36-38]|nr:MAG: D-alanyl-D-alanine carboxypeptidase/D-alanyl-D-alanine-endopeptidase [Candidatus Amoebophilus sp. 36-38]
MNLPIKKLVLLFILLYPSIDYYAQTGNSDANSLGLITENQEIVDKKIFKNASISFYAINLNTNQVIRSINPHASLIPASSLKLLTTATGLEILGEDFKFQTTLRYDGEIDAEGTLQGNIYIQGGADPTLGSKMFKKHYYEPNFIKVWVHAIRDKGIKRIKGAVVGDPHLYDDYQVPATWAVEDLGNDYGAGCGGLSIFDNIYEVLFISDQNNKGQPVIFRISPHLPEEVQIINKVSQGGDTRNICVYGLPYQNTRIIQGTVTPKEGSFFVKGSIPDPAYWAAYSLSRELEKHGIKAGLKPTTIRREKHNFLQKEQIKNESKPSNQIENEEKVENLLTSIHVSYSPALKSIVAVTNRESNNLYAEHILNHIGLKISGKWDTVSGIKALTDFWHLAGIDTLGMFLQDGSGLSRYNAITTKHLVEVLCYMRVSNNFDAFYHSLPIAGETGTLKNLFTKAPLKGNLKAKTGIMRKVLSYTGYCTNIRAEEIAFSLVVNNYHGTPNEARMEIEKMLTALVNEG